METILPIGSVVLLKNAKKRIMITGYYMTELDSEGSKTYDYSGCLFPEGIIDTKKTALFNHDQIDSVFFIGLQDLESMSYRKSLQEHIDELKNNE